MSRLKAQLQNTKVQALAPSTRTNLLTQYKAYLFFCFHFSIPHFPFQEEVVQLFAQYLGNNFKAPKSVQNYIYGLQTIAQLKEWEFPNLGSSGMKFLFKGITKSLAHLPSRAQPINPVILLEISKLINFSDPFQVSAWAVMVLGFLLFCRLSNLLPVSNTCVDMRRQLSRSDVRISEDSVVVSFKWSKTRQDFNKILNIPLASAPGSLLCPKQALLRVCKLSKATPTSHLFAYKNQDTLSVISQVEFVQFFRKILNSAGFNGDAFSGHSFRRGGATWAFLCGVPSESIKTHGDWASDCYQIYLDPSLHQRLQTSQNMLKNV